MVQFDDFVVVREFGFGIKFFVEHPEAVGEETEDGAQDKAHNAAGDEQRRLVVEVKDVLREPHTSRSNQEPYKIHDGKQHSFTDHIGLFTVSERPETVRDPRENACNNGGDGLGPHFAAVHRARKEPDEDRRVDDESNTADGAELCYLTPKK